MKNICSSETTHSEKDDALCLDTVDPISVCECSLRSKSDRSVTMNYAKRERERTQIITIEQQLTNEKWRDGERPS